jgi:hypothetical protein
MGYIVVAIIVWVLSAIVASVAAPEGRAAEFFCLTLFFLGPLGVGFAAVAAPREIVVEGRRRVVCPRCAAAQYMVIRDCDFDCWRCHQRGAVDYRPVGGARVEVTSKPVAAPHAADVVQKSTAAPTVTPVGKTTTVKCSKCQHTQQVPVSASTFQCENCDAKLRRAKTS